MFERRVVVARLHERLAGSSWYCLAVLPRQELAAKRSLHRIGIGTYVPQMRIERQHRRTKAWHERSLMLMPGYVFVEMPTLPPSWPAIRGCTGVRGYLGAPNGDGEIEPFPVPSKAIERLMAAQLNLEFDDTRAAKIRRQELGRNARETTTLRFPPGTRIRAIDGPFATFRGQVTNVNARGHVEAMLQLMGRLVPVDFPPDLIVPVDKSRKAA